MCDFHVICGRRNCFKQLQVNSGLYLTQFNWRVILSQSHHCKYALLERNINLQNNYAALCLEVSQQQNINQQIIRVQWTNCKVVWPVRNTFIAPPRESGSRTPFILRRSVSGLNRVEKSKFSQHTQTGRNSKPPKVGLHICTYVCMYVCM